MRDECKRYHYATLAEHSKSFFQTLLNTQHVISGTPKIVELTENKECNLYEGFFAKKDNKKYFLNINDYDLMPIRVTETTKTTYKEDIVEHITGLTPFSITAAKTFSSIREFIDGFMPFNHSHPQQWTLMKLIAIMGFVGKTMIVVSTPPSFGKTSIYSTLHCINDMSPVFKPRSIPGTLNKINTMGNMVFDEIQSCSTEVRNIIEDIIKFIGDGKPTYFNGALKSNNTKDVYDIIHQSMTFLVNHVSDYKNPDKAFFDNIFEDQGAVDDRLLKFKLDGAITEKFDKEFNIPSLAEENFMYYINMAKYLLYLQDAWLNNTIEAPYKPVNVVNMSNRQFHTYRELNWLISLYAESKEEYDSLIQCMNGAILGYRRMILGDTEQSTLIGLEEDV